MRQIKSVILVSLGMAVGTLIGMHVHTTAHAGGAPCTTGRPSPTAVVRPMVGLDRQKGRLVYRYMSDTQRDPMGVSRQFFVRGPFTVWVNAAAIDPTRIASSEFVTITSKVDYLFENFPTQIAIDVGGKPLQGSFRVTDLRCQFGCFIALPNATNLRWDVRILH